MPGEGAEIAAQDMGMIHKAWTGFGTTLPDLYDAGRQILNTDPTRDAELRQETDEAKQIQAGLGGWGTTGKVLGMIGLTAPTLAIPGANTLAGASLIGAGMGALQPVGTGESRSLNSFKGGAAGFVGQGTGLLASKAVGSAASRVANIEANVAQKAAAQAAAETASARSAAGNAAQNAYRQLEHLRDLNAKGLLTPEQTVVAQQLEKELAQKAAEKLLPAASEKAATAKAFQEAMDSEASRAENIFKDKLSTNEAKSQFMARAKRYWPGVAGAALGHMLFPGVGGIAGAGIGLTIRPTIRSLFTYAKNPAVQHSMLSPISRAGLLQSEAIPPALGLLGSTYANK
jgi:hypothetical protein